MNRSQRRWPIPCVASVVVAISLGVCSPATAATSLNYLGGQFIESEKFVAVANETGKALGVDVRPNLVPFDDVRTKAMLDFRSGVRTWDLVFVYSNWVGDFAASKLVVPIDDLLTTTDLRALVNMSDFIPATAQGLMYQGKLYGMPMLAAPFMLAYRTDLLNDAGERHAFQIKYGYALTVPQTYQHLLDQAAFFTRKKGENLAGKTLEEDMYGIVAADKAGSFLFNRFKHFVVGFGGDLIYDPKTMRPTWNAPENIAAARAYLQLTKFMPPGHQNMTGGEANRLFAAQRAVMVFSSLDGMLNTFGDPATSKVIGKVGYALMPTQIPTRPHAFVQDANGIGISALSMHKEEGFALLARVLSTEGIKALMGPLPGLVPMRASVLNDPQIKRDRPDLAKAVGLVVSEKPYVAYVPSLKEWPQAQDIAAASISEAIAGQKDPELALNDAQAKLLELFKQAGYMR